ncbi:MAG: hypothetical protein HQL67_12455 [Magnetococcales bacterium]|nr:hypothetical protein [Magnetococcales bacterium]
MKSSLELESRIKRAQAGAYRTAAGYMDLAGENPKDEVAQVHAETAGLIIECATKESKLLDAQEVEKRLGTLVGVDAERIARVTEEATLDDAILDAKKDLADKEEALQIWMLQHELTAWRDAIENLVCLPAGPCSVSKGWVPHDPNTCTATESPIGGTSTSH